MKDNVKEKREALGGKTTNHSRPLNFLRFGYVLKT